jgi:hypothetical protein
MARSSAHPLRIRAMPWMGSPRTDHPARERGRVGAPHGQLVVIREADQRVQMRLDRDRIAPKRLEEATATNEHEACVFTCPDSAAAATAVRSVLSASSTSPINHQPTAAQDRRSLPLDLLSASRASS